MNSSKPSGQATTVVSNDPWEGQAPYLKAGFKDAEILKNNPLQAYPNSTVVPFSNQTLSALDATEARARVGSPLLAAGQEQIGATAAGAYAGSNPALGAYGKYASGTGAGQGEMAKTAAGGYFGSNPYLDDVVRRATGTAGAAIDSRFTKAGRYGSGQHANAIAEAAAGIGAQIYGQEYGQERARQQGAASSLASSSLGGAGGLGQITDAERSRMLSAAGQAPQMAAADYSDINRLGGVGAAYEGLAGAHLGDQISRFQFEQQSPRDALQDYMAMIGGGSYGNTQTTTQPLFSNPWAQGLGMVGTGVGIANDLFGSGGVWS